MTAEEKNKDDTTRRLLKAIDKLYQNPLELFRRGFILGVAYGLGVTIGAGIILLILGFIVREFGGLPVIGQWLGVVEKVLPQR